MSDKELHDSICEKLGLPNTATHEDIIAAIDDKQARITILKNDCAKLRNELSEQNRD